MAWAKEEPTTLLSKNTSCRASVPIPHSHCSNATSFVWSQVDLWLQFAQSRVSEELLFKAFGWLLWVLLAWRGMIPGALRSPRGIPAWILAFYVQRTPSWESADCCESFSKARWSLWFLMIRIVLIKMIIKLTFMMVGLLLRLFYDCFTINFFIFLANCKS